MRSSIHHAVHHPRFAGPVDYDPRRLPEIRSTRLNGHYRPVVELAKLVLRSASFELRHGRVRAFSFL